jgi:hypothetical protein
LEHCMVYDCPVGASTRACLHRRLGLPSSHYSIMHRNCADTVNLICDAKTQVRPRGGCNLDVLVEHKDWFLVPN